MLLAALLLVQAVPCAIDATLPAGYAGWKSRGTSLESGEAVTVDTADLATVKDLPATTRPGRVARINFRIATAGLYTVALDQKGWIDVTSAAGGESIKSISHAPGGSCTSIGKLVRFQLAPGAYRLTVTELGQDRLKAMLVKGE
jgi:hypothetical protein